MDNPVGAGDAHGPSWPASKDAWTFSDCGRNTRWARSRKTKVPSGAAYAIEGAPSESTMSLMAFGTSTF